MNNRIVSSLIATAALSIFAVAAFQANAQSMKSDSMMMASSYKLVSVGAPTTGTVEISEKNGTITLKNLKTEAGPDLHVYLFSGNVPSKTTKTLAGKIVDLGKLGAPFKGNFSYKIPAGTKISAFKSLVIWCAQVKTTFAGAALK